MSIFQQTYEGARLKLFGPKIINILISLPPRSIVAYNTIKIFSLKILNFMSLQKYTRPRHEHFPSSIPRVNQLKLLCAGIISLFYQAHSRLWPNKSGLFFFLFISIFGLNNLILYKKFISQMRFYRKIIFVPQILDHCSLYEVQIL